MILDIYAPNNKDQVHNRTDRTARINTQKYNEIIIPLFQWLIEQVERKSVKK